MWKNQGESAFIKSVYAISHRIQGILRERLTPFCFQRGSRLDVLFMIYPCTGLAHLGYVQLGSLCHAVCAMYQHTCRLEILPTTHVLTLFLILVYQGFFSFGVTAFAKASLYFSWSANRCFASHHWYSLFGFPPESFEAPMDGNRLARMSGLSSMAVISFQVSAMPSASFQLDLCVSAASLRHNHDILDVHGLGFLLHRGRRF